MNTLVKILKDISQNAPFGHCLMTDGREITLSAEKKIDTKDFFDMSTVKKTLGIDYFEIVSVPSNKNLILVCDEEGLLCADPVLNFTASMLANQPIYGNVMICHTQRIN